MKNLTLLVIGALLIALGAAAVTSSTVRAAEEKKMLYHVVSFKFKPDATPEQIKAVEQAFVGLKTKIPTIKSLEWGTNVSPEKHDKGFTHCFILAFASEKDRDDYLPHPDHKAFGATLRPILADVFVIDFWAK